jgi:hypothetical protein
VPVIWSPLPDVLVQSLEFLIPLQRKGLYIRPAPPTFSFLFFFWYYCKLQGACKRDLLSPPTSVAYLWSFQTEHSFWDHLRLITEFHQFEPLPAEHFTTIDHLATYLSIGPAMIFTVRVEFSDLDDLDLTHPQKMKAFGCLFCFDLLHLWTLCLFLKLDIQHRAILSDFTRLSKTGLHINVVGPCSHQGRSQELPNNGGRYLPPLHKLH